MTVFAGLLGRPRLLLTLCALFWAGNFVLGRAMHASIPPIGLAFWRWLVASVIVLPFVWPALREQWPLLSANLARMLLLAMLGVSGFNTLVYVGLQTTSAINSVLIQSTLPVLILVLNGLLYRTRARARELLSILVSLVGVLVIISAGAPQRLLHGGWQPGDLWVFAAAWVWALYSVWLRWRPPGLRAEAFLGFTLLTGTLMLLPLYLAEAHAGRTMTWDMPTLLTVTYVAVFPSALAYLFWNRGVAMLGANAAGHFIHLMPVFGTLLAVVFLREVFAWYHALGTALVIVGIGFSWTRR